MELKMVTVLMLQGSKYFNLPLDGCKVRTFHLAFVNNLNSNFCLSEVEQNQNEEVDTMQGERVRSGVLPHCLGARHS